MNEQRPMTERSAMQQLGVLARRGEGDLHAIAMLARGEEVAPQIVDGLVRAGLVRDRHNPRVPARLLLPALALDAALGLSGPQVLSSLVGLLTVSKDANTRGMVLRALEDELRDHVEDLRQPRRARSSLDDLRVVLGSVSRALEGLRESDIAPAQVSACAALCARLIRLLAQHATPATTARRRARALPSLTAAALADAVRDLACRTPVLLGVPSSEALAAAVLGDGRMPKLSARAAEAPRAAARERTVDVMGALHASNPLQAMYSGQPREEALARHAALIGIGRTALDDAGLTFTAERVRGPRPLEWSTSIVPARPALARRAA